MASRHACFRRPSHDFRRRHFRGETILRAAPVVLPKWRQLIRRGKSCRFREEIRERFEQPDRIEAAVVGMSFLQAAEIEGIKTRLARTEGKIGLTGAPAE